MKRLYRNTKEQKIAGVCAGIGEYFNVDPTFVRILFLVVTLLGGAGVLVYLICWIAMPTRSEFKDAK